MVGHRCDKWWKSTDRTITNYILQGELATMNFMTRVMELSALENAGRIKMCSVYWQYIMMRWFKTQRGTTGCLVQSHLCGLNTVDMLPISKCKELQLHQQAHLHGKAKHTVWFNGCLYLSNLQILTKLTNCLPRPTYWQAKTRFLIHERCDKVHDPQ